jgi:hypothetical protein
MSFFIDSFSTLIDFHRCVAQRQKVNIDYEYLYYDMTARVVECKHDITNITRQMVSATGNERDNWPLP